MANSATIPAPRVCSHLLSFQGETILKRLLGKGFKIDAGVPEVRRGGFEVLDNAGVQEWPPGNGGK